MNTSSKGRTAHGGGCRDNKKGQTHSLNLTSEELKAGKTTLRTFERKYAEAL